VRLLYTPDEYLLLTGTVTGTLLERKGDPCEARMTPGSRRGEWKQKTASELQRRSRVTLLAGEEGIMPTNFNASVIKELHEKKKRNSQKGRTAYSQGSKDGTGITNRLTHGIYFA